jgi:putative peptidoglycan lipid II flippase
MTHTSGVVRSALYVSIARVLATFLALLLGMLSARYFGASASKDSYLIAQTIPNLITTLLTGGVYTSLLVTLMEIGRREGITGQAGFTWRTLGSLTLALTPFLLPAILVPRLLIDMVAPGFDAERLELSSHLLPVTAVTALVALCFLIVRCLFQTRSHFVLPNFVYLVIPLTSLVTLVALVGRVGIFALALGPLLGSALALALLSLMIPASLKDPPDFVADQEPDEVRVARRRRFWLALLPMSVGANFGQINLMVDNAFASYLPAGSITLLGFAFVIVSNTELLTTLSFAEVVFPRLASAALRGPEELMDTVRWGLRYMVLMTAPLASGALAFGLPLVRLLFQRGEFDARDALGVAKLLGCYGFEIFFMGFLVLFSRVLFALKRFALVTWTSATGILANALLDFLLMKPFGVYGIALATTCVALLHALLLAPLVRREVPSLYTPEDTRFVVKVVSSAALMGGLVFLWAWVCERNLDLSRDTMRLAEVGTGLLLGGVSYVTILHAMGIDEARAVVRRIAGSLALLNPW